MKKSIGLKLFFIGLLALIAPEMRGQKAKPSCCSPGKEMSDEIVDLGGMKIPNVELLTQDGETVKFYDLVKGKTAAINFIFTTCKTICPPMGANFAKVKQLMGDHVGKDLVMLSVSIDPAVDTPKRLKDWQDKFNAGTGWTMLTGDKMNVDKLLKALKVYNAVKEDHSPILLVGKDGDDNWIKTNGLAEPEKIAEIIGNYLPKAALETQVKTNDGDLAYFTDTKLTDQNGIDHRFYSDLLKDKIVVINAFFSECTGTCPLMSASLQQVQQYFGDRIGRDILLLSISVDCGTDSPDILQAYANRFETKPGWYFLTGAKENVDLVMKKIGLYAETREDHKTIMLVGNVSTRLWKKVDGLSAPRDIFGVIESVIHDQK